MHPTLDVTANIGKEKQNKASGTADTEEVPRELDVTVTQQLWDFGSSNASIRSARLSQDRAQVNLVSTRQALILQGIDAHLSLIRANKILAFAKGSVANIRRQAELEDARVQRGSGFTTDVLQAKTQLAGAEARRNNFAGSVRTAINTYRRFFGKDPGKIEDMETPRVPYEMVPKTLENLIGAMYQGNPGLRLSKIDAEILQETILQTRADEFFPTLNAIAETKRKSDVGGTLRNSTEQLFKVELKYSLNLGLTNVNTLRASEKDFLAANERYIDASQFFEQQARDQWSNFERDRLTRAVTARPRRRPPAGGPGGVALGDLRARIDQGGVGAESRSALWLWERRARRDDDARGRIRVECAVAHSAGAATE